MSNCPESSVEPPSPHGHSMAQCTDMALMATTWYVVHPAGAEARDSSLMFQDQYFLYSPGEVRMLACVSAMVCCESPCWHTIWVHNVLGSTLYHESHAVLLWMLQAEVTMQVSDKWCFPVHCINSACLVWLDKETRLGIIYTLQGSILETRISGGIWQSRWGWRRMEAGTDKTHNVT